MKVSRYILPVVALSLLLWSSAVEAALAIVTSNGGSSPGSQATLQINLSVTSGHKIVVGAICFAAGSCNTGDNVFSDSQGNTYTSVVDQTGRSVIGWATAGSTGTVTITLTPQVSDFMGLGALSVSGMQVVSPVDVSTGAVGTSANASTSLTPTGNAIICAIVNLEDTGGTITVGSGYTQIYEDESFVSVAGGMQCKIVSAGLQTVGWTATPAQPSNGWFLTAVAFKEAAGASAPRRRILNAQ